MTFGLFAFFLVIALREAATDLETLRSPGANAFSRSAIGHGALVETLERLGVPVDIGRFRTVRSTRPMDFLVIASPPDSENLDSILDALDRYPQSARTVLMVVPKWQGRRDRNQPRWLATMELLPERRIVPTLQRALQAHIGGRNSRIARPAATSWTVVTLGDLHPDIDQPQLLSVVGLQVIIGSAEGALIARGQYGDRDLWLLSDPDLINNLGIGRGDNAALALRLIEGALPAGGRVVFDETIHGFEQAPSLWRALLRPPFLPATLAGVIAIAVIAWAANQRFGAPLPAPQRQPGGKISLIANSSDLLLEGGHSGAALAAYAGTMARDVEKRLHLPAGLDDSARDTWLSRISSARKTTTDGPTLLRRAAEMGKGRPSEAQLTAMARDLQQWKREMIDGPGRRSDPV